MKKIILTFLTLIISVSAQAKLKVVATLPVLASLAQEVGGDRVDVVSLARGNQDPHFMDPKPSFVVALSRADVLIEGGLELEIGWLPPLLIQARNPKIQTSGLGYINAAQGLSVLEVPEGKIDHGQGDVHPLGNPHVWLDPRRVKVMAKTIEEGLVKNDPEGKSFYESNLTQFLDRLDAKIRVWQELSQKLKGQSVVTYHKSFSYLVDWLGLQVVGYLEPKPGIPPSPGHILSLIETMKGKKCALIFSESYYDPVPAQELSRKTGTPLLMIETEGDKNESYIVWMDRLIKQIGGSL